jgi:hypothetical protein
MGRRRDPQSARGKVVSYLFADTPLHISEIHGLMQDNGVSIPYNTLCAMLSQLARRGDIVRARRAHYLLPGG